SRCDDSYTDSETEALGHDIVTDAAVAPTCTKTGLTAGSHCSRCDDATVAQQTVSALGHDYSVFVEVKTPATCTEMGTTTYKCSRCDSTEDRQDIGMIPHTWVAQDGKDAGCEEDGYTAYEKCDVCGAEQGKEPISATGHAWTNVSGKPVSCEEDGYTDYEKCSNCGEERGKEIFPATDHAWGDWEVVTEATCTTSGLKQRVCLNNASHVEEEVIEAAHTWSTSYVVVKLPTDTETGLKALYCTVCKELKEPYEIIPSNKHEHEGEWTVAQAPTCEGTGLKEMVCIHCGKTFTEEIPATGHDISGFVTVVEPNCIEAGYMNGTCSVCGFKGDIILPPTGESHNMIIINAVAPTCTKEGLTEGRRCADCGKWLQRQESVPMLEHVDKGGDGKCDNCGESVIVSPDKCDCICHKTSGFMKFIYKLIKPLWKLFKLNRYCNCHTVDHWA
ncbi:MAG: hypothetical protein NC122_02790, partial [Faecalibacterium sp.]|nr:hypothetical protein [Ruminococcus sp.]MCM1485111.1 hypothetical protein [Faecalibacterium sp.]